MCSCCLGSEISWLLGRPGLAEGPGSALSQESGTRHSAWGSHRGRESTGAVGQQPRQLSAAHPQHRVLWLKALAMCPSVCCGIFLHYTHPRLGCGLIQIWQHRNWKGSRACCIPKLLMRMLQHGAPQTAGKGEQVKLCCLAEKMLLVDLA